MGPESNKSSKHNIVTGNPAKVKPSTRKMDKSKPKSIRDLNCLYTNADQLKNKMSELSIRVNNENPDIIGITEVKAKKRQSNIKASEFHIEGNQNYKMFSKNVEDEQGRGLLLFVNKELDTDEVIMDTPFHENLFLQIRINKNKSILLGIVYRSPSSSDENNDALLDLLEEAAGKGHEKLVIMGDFNYPGINWETWNIHGENTEKHEYKFIQKLQDIFLFQHINQPTRWRGSDNPHILDLIITKDEDSLSLLDYQSPLGKSDHCTIFFKIPCKIVVHLKRKQKICYKEANYIEINEELTKTNWKEIVKPGNTPNENWNQFKCALKKVEDKFIPTKIITIGRNNKHSFPADQATLEAIRKKHSLSRRAATNKDPGIRKEYNKMRNKVKKLTRKSRKEYEQNIATKAKTDPKVIWNYIKSKSSTKSDIADLYQDPTDKNSVKITTDVGKANILCNFFNNVFVKEQDGVAPELPPKQIMEEMTNLTVKEEVVLKLLLNLKPEKSPGLDNLHPRYLKNIASSIVEPLTEIFNQTLSTGIIPEDWKKARVSAIFKKGDKSMAGNYRPVSLTSILCKVLETIVREHIIKFMRANNYFSSKQYGFISGRSTCLQLIEVMDKWTEALENGQMIDCIYMDYQKAFDTVPHKRLINKLKAYNFTEQITSWISSFLTGRSQKVTVNGEDSVWGKVTSGIPQGSVLGPILFVIFVNDLPDIVNSYMYLFADDTKIFQIIENNSHCKDLQKDLDTMCNWSDTWLLRMHPDKCKHMRIGRAKSEDEDVTYNLQGKHLETITKEKDIGVIIDSELSFDNHISEKVKKANSMFTLIRRTFQFLDIKSFVPLYKCLVRSQLDYACPVWSPYRSKHIDMIEGVQRRATKCLPGMKHLSYSERLQKLKLPTLAYRRVRGDMIEVYKMIQGVYDEECCNAVILWEDASGRHSRRGNSKMLFPRRATTALRKNNFSIRTVKIWNSLPEHVISVPNVNSFKVALDNHWDKQELVYNYKAELS